MGIENAEGKTALQLIKQRKLEHGLLSDESSIQKIQPQLESSIQHVHPQLESSIQQVHPQLESSIQQVQPQLESQQTPPCAKFPAQGTVHHFPQSNIALHPQGNCSSVGPLESQPDRNNRTLMAETRLHAMPRSMEMGSIACRAIGIVEINSKTPLQSSTSFNSKVLSSSYDRHPCFGAIPSPSAASAHKDAASAGGATQYSTATCVSDVLCSVCKLPAISFTKVKMQVNSNSAMEVSSRSSSALAAKSDRADYGTTDGVQKGVASTSTVETRLVCTGCKKKCTRLLTMA